MMIVLACAALTLAALLYVFWLSPEPVRAKSAAEREREYLQEKREVLYDNLRDLHLEFRMGKLSEPDYLLTKARYQEELALLLHQLENVDKPEKVAAVVPGRCGRCGKDNPADNRFCGACGAELPRAEGIG
jgi:hypothetical protein